MYMHSHLHNHPPHCEIFMPIRAALREPSGWGLARHTTENAILSAGIGVYININSGAFDCTWYKNGCQF